MDSHPHPEESLPVTRSVFSIDPRVITIWRWLAIAIAGVPLVPLAAASLAVALAFSNVWISVILGVAWILVLAMVVFFVGPFPRISQARWRYKVGPRVFESCHGVVWQSAISIPISRLQHVDLHRGPLERRYGLASVELHTAGTQNSSHTIPGLDVQVAEELRDRLIALANAEKQT